MRLKLASALLALSSVAVTGCGFTPVYSNLEDSTVGSIQIDPIPGATGHALRQELVRLLRPGIPGASSGRLEVTFQETTNAFSSERQGGNVRTEALVKANYYFYTDKGALTGQTEGNASFFTAEKPMSDILARRSASERAVKDVAREIVNDLILKAKDDSAYKDPETIDKKK